jgi:hypothetical protein
MRAILSLVALAAMPSLAIADDTFETKAATATKVGALDEVVWSLTTPCDKGDDVQQRQCRLLRDARVKSVLGATLLVEADAEAFELGPWSGAKKSVSVQLTSCVRCSGGMRIEGKPWHITGAAPRVEGGKVRTPLLYDSSRQFSDEAAAKAWLKTLKNTRVEMVIKIPDRRRWLVGGKEGLLVDVLAYRVVTPCNGNVVIANPASANVSPDRKACNASEPAGVASPDGVSALTGAMVQSAMKPVVDAAMTCHERYGVDGSARLDITISGDGTVARYEQTGDFLDTPTGQCIDTAMRSVQFPRSQKARTKIGYPIVLQ